MALVENSTLPEQDASKLLSLLGTPKKTSHATSCFFISDRNGNELTGKDGEYRYKHVVVRTYQPSGSAFGGAEFLMGFDEL